ncbi:MAG: hypothetical protein OEM02_01515 [Desulfobulbaceae bacterium]|nr:hypothetical protein [Desulfobulbaceae bacterium]
MEQNIEDVLTLEIKKQIADRYFGFRKLIEEDIKEYDNQVLNSSARLERIIGFEFVRMYILLKDEKLIQSFLKLAGQQYLPFYDPYLTESPTIRKRLFSGLKLRGFTNGGRFKNLVFDTYDALSNQVEVYRKNIALLSDDWENIAEEIEVFYKQNDISSIMSFLRTLDGDTSYRSGSMEGGINPENNQRLEQKMKVRPPRRVEEQLPEFSSMPQLSAIKKQLKNISSEAYDLHDELDWRVIVNP